MNINKECMERHKVVGRENNDRVRGNLFLDSQQKCKYYCLYGFLLMFGRFSPIFVPMLNICGSKTLKCTKRNITSRMLQLGRYFSNFVNL